MWMFEDMRSRFVIGLMTGASIVSISLNLPLWICSYFFKKRGMKLRQIVFLRGTASWILPVFGLTMLLALKPRCSDC